MAQKKENSKLNSTDEKDDIAKKALLLETKIKKLKLELEQKTSKEEK